MPSSGCALPACLSRSKESSSSLCFLRSASLCSWYGFAFSFVFAIAFAIRARLSLLVVRNVPHQRAGAIDLFQQDDAGQLMRERHGRKAEDVIGALPDGLVESDVPAHDEIDAVRLSIVSRSSHFANFKESIDLAPLVEDDHVPLCGNRGQQPRRMGAHDSHIVLALSTAFAAPFRRSRSGRSA